VPQKKYQMMISKFRTSTGKTNVSFARTAVVIFSFILFFNAFCYAKTIRLGVSNPTPRILETILFLVDNNYISVDSLEIIGICHGNSNELVKSANEFIEKSGRRNISIFTIKNNIPVDKMFVVNSCTDEFKELFSKTDGLIFTGGADILPQLYGEEAFLTTEPVSSGRNWEVSFLFHLLGNFQNKDFIPFLEQRPDYVVLGICLGMQKMNVATGGTMYQDIPFQIYKKTTYESVLKLKPDVQHRNDRNRIDNTDKRGSVPHFHRIKINPNSFLNFNKIRNPLIVSSHHQALKKIGKNLQVIATSMDNKVVEAVTHTKYKNVYGTQFHPEVQAIYTRQEFIYSDHEKIILDNNDQLFHKYFWQDFSDRLKNK
jgi:putative glutamine amidotransferase